MSVKIVSSLAAIAFILSASLAYAQQSSDDITVEAEGFGASRKDALLKAKREAVEIGIGTILISQTEIKNYELQEDVILTKTVGAVKRYDILADEKKSDNTYYVKIRAGVSLAGIKEDLAALKILLESMDKPRMMVVIQEEKGRDAESAILDYLSAKEFELVDPAVVAALMKKESATINGAAAGDPAAAAEIGSSNGAEYIIVGQVTKSLGSSQLLSSSGLVSGQASITAKVVNCSNAKIIASKSARSAAAHISEDVAMAMAAGKAGKKMMDKALFEAIVVSFQDMINNGMPLDVTIKRVANYKMQKALRKSIGELANVVSVSKRSFSKGQLHLTVFFKGNADVFSDSVDGKSFQGRTFSVTDVEGSRVVILLE